MKPKKLSADQKTLLVIILTAFCLGVPLGIQIAKKYQKTTYAHGLTYFGPASPTPPPAEWATMAGKIFPYQLAYPKSLNLVQFPNDPNDSVGLGGPEKLILFVEKIDGSPKKFVQDYWQLYSGLAGLKNLQEFTNPQGLNGFEVNYTYKGTSGQSLDIFFMIPKNNQHLIHLMKGELEEKVFREIVDRFEIKR